MQVAPGERCDSRAQSAICDDIGPHQVRGHRNREGGELMILGVLAFLLAPIVAPFAWVARIWMYESRSLRRVFSRFYRRKESYFETASERVKIKHGTESKLARRIRRRRK